MAACRVAVVERAALKGRDQEWNISWSELQALVRPAPSQWQSRHVVLSCRSKSGQRTPCPEAAAMTTGQRVLVHPALCTRNDPRPASTATAGPTCTSQYHFELASFQGLSPHIMCTDRAGHPGRGCLNPQFSALDTQLSTLQRPDISELDVLCQVQAEQGILDEAAIDECVTSRFNPIRAGFHGHADVWTRDVLNLGVRPDLLIDKARTKRRRLLPWDFQRPGLSWHGARPAR